MPSDNVTPFRRRPPPKPVQRGGGLTSHRGKAILVQALTLAAFALSYVFPSAPFSYIAMAVAIAGIAVALSNRAEAMPWAQTHHEHAMRTLVIGYAVLTLVSLLTFVSGALVVVYFYAQIAVMVWAAIRAGIGLILATMRRPIWHPRGPLL